MLNYQKPLVSVIIPSYNHATYVEEAILSVINQTYGYGNIQLIVADDCSTDRSAVILRELAVKYGFKLIIHQQNVGICSTLNEMISISDGEYIIPFASDDILISDRIEIQINILKRNPDVDVLTGDFILIDEHGKILSDFKPNTDDTLTSYNFDEIFLLQWPGFSSGTAIIKRDLFLRIGAYDTNYKVEDYYFWLKATYNNAKIVRCNLPFLYYRVHQKSISSNGELMDQEVYKILATYNFHPKYSLALQNRAIYNIRRYMFYSKTKAIQQLVKNPQWLFNKKIIKVLLMLILPTFVLKRKFPENYFRHAIF